MIGEAAVVLVQQPRDEGAVEETAALDHVGREVIAEEISGFVAEPDADRRREPLLLPRQNGFGQPLRRDLPKQVLPGRAP